MILSDSCQDSEIYDSRLRVTIRTATDFRELNRVNIDASIKKPRVLISKLWVFDLESSQLRGQSLIQSKSAKGGT
jgi:hypothetical protein